jgi:hypothetical protein
MVTVMMMVALEEPERSREELISHDRLNIWERDGVTDVSGQFRKRSSHNSYQSASISDFTVGNSSACTYDGHRDRVEV